MRILLEPLDFNYLNNSLEILRIFAQHPAPAVLATAFATGATGLKAMVGQRLLLTKTGAVRGTPLLASQLAAAAHAALAQG